MRDPAPAFTLLNDLRSRDLSPEEILLASAQLLMHARVVDSQSRSAETNEIKMREIGIASTATAPIEYKFKKLCSCLYENQTNGPVTATRMTNRAT